MILLSKMNAFYRIVDFFRNNILRVSHWETWHWLIKYIPLIPAWCWYCMKARSLWFFTTSNPTLTFGGFEGENKREMYAQLPPGTYPATHYIVCNDSFLNVWNMLQLKGFTFPAAVKPDVGRMGLMFRKINSFSELQTYHDRMKCDYLIQEFIEYPLEVSVFYYRYPGHPKGAITGFVKKVHLTVTGDGKSTLWELILNYPRVRFRLEEMKLKHAADYDKIIGSGQNYILSHALNLSRGGKLINLEHEKDERLLQVFDTLSKYSGGFYYGRYDIKCKSIEDLKNGKNFSILEFNGSGAEPHHIYGNGNTFFQAMQILLNHWRILYKISVANHRKGIAYWTFCQGINHLKKARQHFRTLWELESESEVTLNQKISRLPENSHKVALNSPGFLKAIVNAEKEIYGN